MRRLGGGLTRLSTLNRLRVACSTGTFPQTVVIATTSSSGERRARRIASASSTPGSVSMMTRVKFPFFIFNSRVGGKIHGTFYVLYGGAISVFRMNGVV